MIQRGDNRLDVSVNISDGMHAFEVWGAFNYVFKPLQNHDFSKIATLVKNYTKKIVLAIFKIGSKLVKRYPKITFSLFSKLPNNYTKITNKIQIAPLRSAVGFEM